MSELMFDPPLFRVLRRLVVFALLAAFLGAGQSSSAQRRNNPRGSRTTPIRDYQSKRFLIHTDLSAREAKILLSKMETMLTLISKYWGRAPSGVIECFVVKDLKNWPANSLLPDGRKSIEAKAGITLSLVASQGNAFRAKSLVFAIAERGVAQHEAVHAYCHQTFGTAGPTWYAEGMAEMGCYWKENDSSVNASPHIIDYLKKSKPKSLAATVAPGQATGDSWQNYAWRWALCHMLANNPNYAPRFRPLGLGLLAKQNVSFEQVYGPMANEISFEYLFFLKHLDRGFRVDLCSWDWNYKYRSIDGSNGRLTAKLEAAQGWQPAGLLVSVGSKYDYSSAGNWQTSKTADEVDADGDRSGKGRLVGAIFKDFQLSEPFQLGAYGTFTAPADGKLFLRCQDDWNGIADNEGRMTVKFKVAGKGAPLRDPRK